MHHDHPELIKDQWWDEVHPPELPYTVASEQYREDPPLPSTAKISVSHDEGELVSPPSVRSISESGVSFCYVDLLPAFLLQIFPL